MIDAFDNLESMDDRLLEIRDLKKHFPITKGLVLARVKGSVKAVDGVSFSLAGGETLGLVGESGCGKTTLSKVILRLEQPTSGTVLFKGKDVFALKGEGLKRYRKSTQAVFQDPFGSLNPRMRVRRIIAEPIAESMSLGRNEIQEKVRDLLEMVGLSRDAGDLFPHEFSGGQRQRIAIARAIGPGANLIILDEAVSGLDVSIRTQIINLLLELQERMGLSYVFIAHDLASAVQMSHRIAVMYMGKIVELALSEELALDPLHPYAQALFAAALPAYPGEKGAETVLPGEVPSVVDPPPGCRFRPRCRYAESQCAVEDPPLRNIGNGRMVACYLRAGVYPNVA